MIDAIGRYLTESNANHGGLFATSRESDAYARRSARGDGRFPRHRDPRLGRLRREHDHAHLRAEPGPGPHLESGGRGHRHAPGSRRQRHALGAGRPRRRRHGAAHRRPSATIARSTSTSFAGQAVAADAAGGRRLRVERRGHSQPGGRDRRRWPTQAGALAVPRCRALCAASLDRRAKLGSAIFWLARRTNSSGRTWACCGGGASCSETLPAYKLRPAGECCPTAG